MKLIPPIDNGVFAFTSEDSGRDVIFVKGRTVIADIENGHCSNHVYYASGCDDCTIAALFTITEKSNTYISKATRTHIHQLEIKPGQPGPKLQLVRAQMARKVFVFLVNAKSNVIKALKKAAEGELVENPESLFEAAFSSIEWDELPTDIVIDLLAAANDGASDGFNQLNLKSKNEDTIDTIASNYASYRAAEIIGKKWSEGNAGVLVDNPDAKFVISDTTKDDLHDIIHKAASDGLTVAALEAIILAAGIFTFERAELIAKTEVALAQASTHLEAWGDTGKIKLVKVVLSNTHVGPDLCDFVAEGGPYTLEELPMIPIHPNCGCSVEVVEVIQ